MLEIVCHNRTCGPGPSGSGLSRGRRSRYLLRTPTGGRERGWLARIGCVLAHNTGSLYLQHIEQSDREQKEIETRADAFEREVARREHAADRFDFGTGCLEAALVIMSVTLLTKRRLYWGIGLALACVGVVIASTGFFVR